MTLGYLGPHYAEGGLVVPLGQDQEEQLPALLAESAVCLRASSLPDDWEAGDPWPNEGSTGSDQDATYQEGDGVPVLSSEGGITHVGTDSGSWQYVVPYHEDTDLGTADWTMALWMRAVVNTAVDDSDVFAYLFQRTGVLGVDGTGYAFEDFKLPSFGVDGVGCVASITTTTVANLGAHWDTEWHLVVVRADRSGDMETWIDGEVWATDDMTSISGDLDPDDNDITFGAVNSSGPCEVAALCHWGGRLLTDTEITVDLPAALGIS